MQLALPAAVVSALLMGLGARVLRQARDGGGLPDRMVGVFFLCLGLGAAPALLANDPGVVPRAAARGAMAFGHASVSVAFGALAVFAWRCFGPRSAWRRSLATGVGLALVLLWIVQAVIERFEPPGGDVVRATALVRASCLVWAFGEALRFQRMMQRRLGLGLADPVVANRFGLWCVWIGSLLTAMLVTVSVRFLVPGYGPDSPTALRLGVAVAIMLLATQSAVSLWLAFFPPRWYVTRVEAGAKA